MRAFISVRFLLYITFSFFLLLMYFSLKHVKILSETLLNNENESIETGNKSNYVKLVETAKSASELEYIETENKNNYAKLDETAKSASELEYIETENKTNYAELDETAKSASELKYIETENKTNYAKLDETAKSASELKFIETGNKSTYVKLNKTVKSTSDLKYILQWTSPQYYLFSYMGIGQQGFIDRNCTYTNCFVTSDRSYLGGIEKFDVIAFIGPEVIYYAKNNLPESRAPHQKYVFASIESSDYYPVCADYLNDFFNWTWTFKTNSDARWGYMAIRDSDGIVIGPNSIMHWIKFEDMKPVSDKLKEKLKSKKKAVAWFVSNCYSISKRELLVKELQNELKKYNLIVDIYGNCGPLKCSTNDHKTCLKMLENDYYFYLSFENSFSEDYVTEKLLHALQHNTVPIVFGGANYTRFMPDGIYLNARELGAQKVAEKIYETILNPEKYAEYFRWRNHYSYHTREEDIETDDYCGFCKMLNDKELVEKVSMYKDMKKWWNTPNRC